MSIKRVYIEGIRSFKNSIDIRLAKPNGKTIGSGFNMLVGPNNSGKSSFIESIFLLNSNVNMIPVNIRNVQSKNSINVVVELSNGEIRKMFSADRNPGFVYNKKYKSDGEEINTINSSIAYILSSRRTLHGSFFRGSTTWNDFTHNGGNQNYRRVELMQSIGGRFQNIINSRYREVFDYELKYILGYLPKWALEIDDSNNFYIAFQDGKTINDNSGAGDGFINLFIILTSIYDAPDDATIIIDEPEISLHPDVQKRLMERLVKHSKDKQIILSTHSTHFIDLELLKHGAKLFRFNKTKESTKISTIKKKNIYRIEKLINAVEQPYLLDSKSKEIFFQNKIILVEGIDDYYCYRKIFENYHYKTSGEFYGWGVGGAERIEHLLEILHDLKYEQVVVILDGDKQDLRKSLSIKYRKYRIYCIPTVDIRDKDAPYINNIKELIEKIANDYDIDSRQFGDKFQRMYTEKYCVHGLLKNRTRGIVKKEYEDKVIEIINDIKEYFNENDTSDIANKIDDFKKQIIASNIIKQYISDFPEKTINYLQSVYYENDLRARGGEGPYLLKASGNIYKFKLELDAIDENGKKYNAEIYFDVDLKKNKVVNLKQEIK